MQHSFGGIPTALPFVAVVLAVFFFLKKRFYLFMREREREREKQVPCREPDVGLDPWTPGSHAGLKTAKLLSHPGCPGSAV